MTDATGLTAKVPGTDWMDKYDTGGEFIPPPQAKELIANGRTKFVQFTLQAPSGKDIKTIDDKGAPLVTREGWVKAVIEGIKEVSSGYLLGQTHIGTGQYKKYDRRTKQPTGEFRSASPALDYFRAHGMDVRPGSFAEYQSYFEATADRQFPATLDWNAYDKDAQSDVAAKWEDFPPADATDETKKEFDHYYPGVNPTGMRLPFVEKNGKKFWARAQVKRYVSVVADGGE